MKKTLTVTAIISLMLSAAIFLFVKNSNAELKTITSSTLNLPPPTPAPALEYFNMGSRQEVAKSVALIVHKDQAPSSGLQTTTSPQPLCGVSLNPQPQAQVKTSCSGVLVAANVVATVGHCINQLAGANLNAANLRVVFGYRYNTASSAQFATSIYEVDKIVGHYHHRCMRNKNHLDWGLLLLKPPPAGTPPLPAPATISTGTISVNSPIYVIGYPRGLPLKLSEQANIKAVGTNYFDGSTMCAMGQSSGSPVFNSNNKVIGLVSEVLGDMEPRAIKACQLSQCLGSNPGVCTGYRQCLTTLRTKNKKCKPNGRLDPCTNC